MTQVLSNRALNRALLQRQWLSEPVDATPLEAVEHLVGLQAQLDDPPYYQLWSRLRDFDVADLSTLLETGSAVRIAVMRGTVHLVSAQDCGRLRRLTQPCHERDLAGSQHGKQLAGVDFDRLTDQSRRLLDEGPVTNAELGRRLQRHWPQHAAVHLAYGARCLLPLVQVPPRGIWGKGGTLRYALADQHLGEAAAATADPESTVLRYLRAFGPASVRDYQKWSGLTRQREVFARLESRLRRYRGPEGGELFDLAEASTPDEEAPAPRVVLVGPFDNIVLSHADRSRVIDEVGLRKLLRPNGLFPGIFLLDGFAAGEWSVDRKSKPATVSFAPFGRLSKKDSAALEAAGERLRRFVDSGRS